MRATATRGDERAPAPLVDLELPPTADEDDEAPEAVEEEAGYPELVELPVLSRAAATSTGSEKPVPFSIAERSREPLEIMLGFIAMTAWVYIMFSAMYGRVQFGIADMSMFIPHIAALDWLAVTLFVYDMAAAVEGYMLAMEGIIIEAEPGCIQALGGLMIPNMPFSQ